jgi:hypothetical protein
MKRFRKEKEFLEQIKTIPNISLACEKVGLSRNTIYRWRNDDPDFKNRLDESLGNGVESVNDLAESKLISQINSGNMPAIKYWLDNNKKNYMRPRPKDFWESLEGVGPITKIIISTTQKQCQFTNDEESDPSDAPQ